MHCRRYEFSFKNSILNLPPTKFYRAGKKYTVCVIIAVRAEIVDRIKYKYLRKADLVALIFFSLQAKVRFTKQKPAQKGNHHVYI